MAGPIGLSPGYGREFKRLSFPPEAEKTAERNRTLSGRDNPLNPPVKFFLLFPVIMLIRCQVQDWDLTPLRKKLLVRSNVLPPLAGPIGLSPGYSLEINPWTHQWIIFFHWWVQGLSPLELQAIAWRHPHPNWTHHRRNTERCEITNFFLMVLRVSTSAGFNSVIFASGGDNRLNSITGLRPVTNT